jgi:hypothetical protein
MGLPLDLLEIPQTPICRIMAIYLWVVQIAVVRGGPQDLSLTAAGKLKERLNVVGRWLVVLPFSQKFSTTYVIVYLINI